MIKEINFLFKVYKKSSHKRTLFIIQYLLDSIMSKYYIAVGTKGNPTDIVLNDTSLKINVLLWVTTFKIILIV